MLKILNITEEGRGGGPLNRIVYVADVLKDQVKTTVVFPDENSDNFKKKLDDKNIAYHQLSLHRLTREKKHLLAYIFYFFKETIAIRKLIKKENIDIVHCNAAWQIKGILAAYFTSAKSLWHLNDSQAPRIIRILFLFFSFFADGFVFASEKTKSYYQSISPFAKKAFTRVMQAPVNVERFSNVEKNTLLQEYPGKKLISVGYINHNKGFHHLIEAFSLLKNNAVMHLFIVGQAFDNQKPYFDELKKLIGDKNLENVHFLGFRADIPQLLKSCDLYVCPSSFEASPIAVWEALASGIPVVSTNVGDVDTFFSTYKYGTTVQIEDSKALAIEIERVLADKEDLKHKKLLGPTLSLKEFSLTNISKQHYLLYQELYNDK